MILIMKSIALIDTGAANIHSVFKALKHVCSSVEITNDFNLIQKAGAVVFPGVGAFSAVMESINSKNLKESVKKSIELGKPFLGICVGMQVLFEKSEEHGKSQGLGILKGKVIKFKKAKKVPHIGWNNVNWTTDHGQQTTADKQASVVSGPLSVVFPQYYFVHSYYVVPEDKSIICGETEYDGEKFVSAVKKDNLFAVQFHPEKSGETGLELLKSFLKGG